MTRSNVKVVNCGKPPYRTCTEQLVPSRLEWFHPEANRAMRVISVSSKCEERGFAVVNDDSSGQLHYCWRDCLSLREPVFDIVLEE